MGAPLPGTSDPRSHGSRRSREAPTTQETGTINPGGLSSGQENYNERKAGRGLIRWFIQQMREVARTMHDSADDFTLSESPALVS